MAILHSRLPEHPVGMKRKSPGGELPGQNQRKKKMELASQARRRFRRKCHARRIRRLAALCGSSARGNYGLRLACGDCQVLTLADEGQTVLLLVPINADEVTEVNLLGRQQVRQWVYHVTFDGALKVPRAVALVGRSEEHTSE